MGHADLMLSGAANFFWKSNCPVLPLQMPGMQTKESRFHLSTLTSDQSLTSDLDYKLHVPLDNLEIVEAWSQAKQVSWPPGSLESGVLT